MHDHFAKFVGTHIRDQFEGVQCVGAQAGSLCKKEIHQLVEYAFQECSKLTEAQAYFAKSHLLMIQL